MQAAEVLALREALRERFPNAQPVLQRTTGAVATGLGPLDALLPGRGLPRGRVTLWRSGAGSTAVLRAACREVGARGERAAWIDVQRLLAAESWRREALLLRPNSETEALICAEELLRCGGFSLVVLAGGGRMFEREVVRLSRAVHAGGSAFVAIAPAAAVAHLRLSSRIAPEAYHWKLNPFGDPVTVESVRLEVHAQSMGWNGRCSLVLPVAEYEPRTALDPLLHDRRTGRTSIVKSWTSKRRRAQRG